MTTVKLLALWQGWCDDCHVERPLALTEHGEHGLRAWLKGIGSEDRSLVLACEVCGHWQPVPQHDEDDPEPAEPELAAPPETLSSPPEPVRAVRTVVVPHPRPTDVAPDRVLDLVSQGLDVLSPPR